jgi:ATP-dependent RNA helicase DeaD
VRAITLVEPREHRLLRNIESSTRTKLELVQIPTVADVRERRLEMLRATLRETLMGDGLDRFRAVVEPLAGEFDLVDVALAAVSLAAEASGRDGETEAEIAPATLFDQRGPGPGGGERPEVRQRQRDGRPQGGPWTRLFVGAGRNVGMRPGDLVGAIAGEAGVPASTVGAIQIAENYSIVEVSEASADHVIRALRGSSIRGRPVPVRLDQAPGGRRPRPGARKGPS